MSLNSLILPPPHRLHFPSMSTALPSSPATPSSPTSTAPTAGALPFHLRRKKFPALTIRALHSASVTSEQDSRDDTWSPAQMDELFESALQLRNASPFSDVSAAEEQLEHRIRTSADDSPARSRRPVKRQHSLESVSIGPSTPSASSTFTPRRWESVGPCDLEHL